MVILFSTSVRERLGQEVVLALLRVERAEEPEFVFGDWTANVDAGVDFREAIRRSAGERKLLGLNSRTNPWLLK